MANNITLLHREKQHLEPLERDNGGEHIFTSKFPAVPVPYLTLPEFVLENWEKYEEKVAIVEAIGGKEFTYRQVVDGVRDFGNGLKGMGMVKGSVVIVLLPNIAEYPIIALGVMSAGGVFSGSNPLAHPSEVRKQVEDSGAKLIVTNGPCYEKVRDLGIPVLIVGGDPIENTIPWEELLKRGRNNDHFALKGDLLSENDQFAPTSKGSDENIHFTPDHATGWKNDHFTPKQGEVVCQDDLCALPYSSGTTGTSKGVMLTHRNLVANMCSTLFGVTPEMIGEFTTLGLMPFFHIYGITGICCATLRNKGKVVVMSRFELRLFLDALITHGVNFAPIVPPIMLSLVKNPIVDEFDLSRLKLRSVMTAAAPLAPDLLQVFEQKFPGVQVQEAYGLTEHSCITMSHCTSEEAGGVAKRTSVGLILPNLEIKFIDPDTRISLPKTTIGELCVRSQCVMKGYYKNEEETARTLDSEGWLHTGDVGYIDDDGHVFIVDRIKELIKYKGFQVAPAELEAILLSHPSVEDAAVVAVADQEAGEIPAACVVMAPTSKESEEEIMKYVASNVASYKRVRVVHFVNSIPKSPSGKILRRLLRDSVMRRLNSSSNTSKDHGSAQSA